MKLTRELRADEKIVLDAMGQTAEALPFANYGLRGLHAWRSCHAIGCCARHTRDAQRLCQASSLQIRFFIGRDAGRDQSSTKMWSLYVFLMQDEINQAQECGALHDNTQDHWASIIGAFHQKSVQTLGRAHYKLLQQKHASHGCSERKISSTFLNIANTRTFRSLFRQAFFFASRYLLYTPSTVLVEDIN